MPDRQQAFNAIMDAQSEVLKDIFVDLQDCAKVRASAGAIRGIEIPQEQMDPLCGRYDAWRDTTISALKDFFTKADMAEHMTTQKDAQRKADKMGADLTTQNGFTSFYSNVIIARASRKLVQHRTGATSLPSASAASTKAVMERFDPLFSVLRQAHQEWKAESLGEGASCDLLDAIVERQVGGHSR